MYGTKQQIDDMIEKKRERRFRKGAHKRCGNTNNDIRKDEDFIPVGYESIHKQATVHR